MSTDADTGRPGGGTFRLIYRSRDLIPAEERRAELGALFSTSRANNKRARITGALLLAEDCFVQTLEGEEAAVWRLYTRIEQDARHDSVQLVEARTVPDRVFSRWAMAEVGGDGEPDIPLLARVGGIAPAASRGDTTPEQADVLSLMREAASGSPAQL